MASRHFQGAFSVTCDQLADTPGAPPPFGGGEHIDLVAWVRISLIETRSR